MSVVSEAESLLGWGSAGRIRLAVAVALPNAQLAMLTVISMAG